jgi:phage shock protein E
MVGCALYMQTTGNKPIEIAYADLPTSGASVIDCRSEEEFEEAHYSGAINIPLQHVSVRKDTFPFNEDEAFYVYCNSGNRSATFVTYLRSIGYVHCQSIAGGIELWGDQLC